MTPSGRWRRLKSREILHLGVEDAEALWADTARGDPGDLLGGGYPTHPGAVHQGVPGPLARRLRHFTARGAPNNALLIRGLLPDLPDLPPTPPTPVPPGGAGRDADRAGRLLLAVMSVLGEPSARDGRLVQHVVPALDQNDTHTHTSTGSDEGGEFLPWSVEDAYAEDRCHVLGLLCLRGVPDAVTLFSPVRAGDLALIAQWTLREPRFTLAPDPTHGMVGARRRVAVLSGPAEDLRMRFDSIHQAPLDPRDRQAATALYHLHQALQYAAVGHVMEPGDLLVLDNRRAAQARLPVAPRHDGTDQWLLRVMVGPPEQER